MCGVEIQKPAHGLASVVGPRQEVVGASCSATRLLLGELPGILTSELVGLVVQGRSGLEMRSGANQVPTPLGAHPAELSRFANVPLLGIVLHHHRPQALYDCQKVQR